MPVSLRQLCGWFARAGLVAGAPVPLAAVDPAPGPRSSRRAAETGSHIGSLCPFVQKQADRSDLELSFLRPGFRNLNVEMQSEAWEWIARWL